MYGIGMDETPTVYWVVLLGTNIRHAISSHPGALIHGQLTPTECGVDGKVPFSTPLFRKPPTVLITDRCPWCKNVLKERPEIRHIIWDF